MTKRAYRRRQQELMGLLAPRLPDKPRADVMDYAKHVLDSTKFELQPRYHRDAAADDPFLDPMKSEVVAALALLIEYAFGHTGQKAEVLLEEVIDLRWYCENVTWASLENVNGKVVVQETIGLSENETEALLLKAEGWSNEAIATWLGISHMAARQRVCRGRRKLAGWLPLDSRVTKAVYKGL